MRDYLDEPRELTKILKNEEEDRKRQSEGDITIRERIERGTILLALKRMEGSHKPRNVGSL